MTNQHSVDQGPVEVSVVIPTFRRPTGIGACLRSVLAQRCEWSFEVLVVDNNSGDGTADDVMSVAARDSRVRYLLERQQGVAFARNCGISAARAPLIAFIDDDVEAAEDWLTTIVRTFHAHAEVDFVGGRVLPLWPDKQPEWLSPRKNWSPLGVIDHGERELTIGAERPWPLSSGNMAVRRRVFETLGSFAPDFQRVGSGVRHDRGPRVRATALARWPPRTLRAKRVCVFSDPAHTALQELSPPLVSRTWNLQRPDAPD